MRRFLLVLPVVVGAGFLAIAQPSVRAEQTAPPAAAVAAARDLLDASGATKQFEAVVPMMIGQMRQMFVSMKPANQKEIVEVFDLIGRRFIDRKGEMFEEVAKLYAAKLSADELKQLAAFFRTGVGAKFVSVQPELVQQSMIIGQRWGERIGREVDADVRRELKKRGVDL